VHGTRDGVVDAGDDQALVRVGGDPGDRGGGLLRGVRSGLVLVGALGEGSPDLDEGGGVPRGSVADADRAAEHRGHLSQPATGDEECDRMRWTAGSSVPRNLVNLTEVRDYA
jgi:hypothetical protein